MDHAVQTFFQFHERTVGGKVADLAADLGSGRILLHGEVPRVGFQLANAEGDFLFLAVDGEHDGFDFGALLENIRRLGDALGPREFSDVHEAFDTGFEFDEGTVRHEIDDLAFDFFADGILRFDAFPRIGELLLEAEADAFLVLVDIENDNVDFLANLEQLGRMSNTTPAHIRDVQQAVEPVEVDERAEVGDVLDGTLADVAGHHLGEERGTAGSAFLFDQFAAGKNDVLPLHVDLNNLELEGLADEGVQILGRDNVELRCRQEGFDPDIDDETALDDGLDAAIDGAAFVADREDLVPVLAELGAFFGENDHAVLVFEAFDQHFKAVAYLDFLDVVEFVGGDASLALVTDVHKDFLVTDFDDVPFDNFAFGKADIALRQGFFHGHHDIL